jgi:hypothetical protein
LVVARGHKIGTLYTLKSKLQKSDIVAFAKGGSYNKYMAQKTSTHD